MSPTLALQSPVFLFYVALVAGVMILGFQEQFKMTYFKSILGTSILTGAFMATLMFANVWLVIWPNQRKVIANARNVQAGGEADPTAVAAGRKAAMASRQNTIFSFTLLLFMVGLSPKSSVAA